MMLASRQKKVHEQRLQESSRIWERQKRPALKACKKDLNLLPLDFDLVRLRLDSDLQKCKKNFMFSATETVGIYNQMETCPLQSLQIQSAGPICQFF